MTLSRTRVVDTLIVLLTVAVVGLTVLPWLVPKIQEAVRDKPDSGRVLAEAAERIESELTTARRELALIDGDTPTGTVRIGTFATAIRALILPLLLMLEDSLPGIELVIEEIEEREEIETGPGSTRRA